MRRFPTWAVLTRPSRFGLFLTGAMLTNLGTWAQAFAAVLLIYRLTGSALQVGLVTVAQFGAAVLLVPWTGAVADRFDRRRVVAVCQLASMAVGGVLVALSAADALTAPLLLALSVVLGVFQAFQVPAQLSLVPLLIRPDDLEIGNALNAAQVSLARAVGPVLAAGMVALWGFTGVFVFNTATFVIYLIAILLVRPLVAQQPPAGRSGMRDSLRLVRRTPSVFMLMCVAFLAGGATDIASTLGPALAIELTGSDAAAGIVLAVLAAGSAAVVLLTSWLRRFRRRLAAALLIQAIAVAVMAVSTSFAVTLAAAAVVGAAFIVAANRSLALLQVSIPPQTLGRMMALWTVGFSASRPTFAMIEGVVADWAGWRWAMAVVTLVGLCAAVWVWRHSRVAAPPSDTEEALQQDAPDADTSAREAHTSGTERGRSGTESGDNAVRG